MEMGEQSFTRHLQTHRHTDTQRHRDTQQQYTTSQTSRYAAVIWVVRGWGCCLAGSDVGKKGHLQCTNLHNTTITTITTTITITTTTTTTLTPS